MAKRQNLKEILFASLAGVCLIASSVIATLKGGVNTDYKPCDDEFSRVMSSQ